MPAAPYNPTIVMTESGAQISVPTPLRQTDVQYTNRISRVSIPQRHGALVTSRFKGGLNVSFAGLIHAASRSAVIGKTEELVDTFQDETQTFKFYRYFSDEYKRWFADCVVDEFAFHWSALTRLHLPYDFTLFVPDGRENEEGTFPTEGGVSGTPTVASTTRNFNGPLVVNLNDALGASSVMFKDDNGNVVAKIDSLGNFFYTGLVMHKDTISE